MSRAKAGKLGGKSKKISGSALAKCEGLGYNPVSYTHLSVDSSQLDVAVHRRRSFIADNLDAQILLLVELFEISFSVAAHHDANFFALKVLQRLQAAVAFYYQVVGCLLYTSRCV